MSCHNDTTKVIDMATIKIEQLDCLALSGVPRGKSDLKFWFIHFITLNLTVSLYYTFALEMSCISLMSLFDNKLLIYKCEYTTIYKAEYTLILVYNTSKWVIDYNESYFDIGIDEP